jgi:hypothetical protein
MNFKTIFNRYIAALQPFKKQLGEIQFDLARLNSIRDTIKEDKNSFSYTFTAFGIVLPKKYKPSHTMPKNVGSIAITISVKNTVEVRWFDGKKVEDPMIKLDDFNIILKSGDTNFSSWHLDRHLMNPEEGDGDYLHPIYHMTYAGHYMESKQEEDIDVYGKALIVRAPRLMHPPLELILGLDFIFRHYVPRNSLPLLDHAPYKDIVEVVKKEIWFPFALALAKNYCNNIDIDGDRYGFDDYFSKRVIGYNPLPIKPKA